MRGVEYLAVFFAKEALKMNEGVFKTKIVSKLKTMFPGCELIKPDSGYSQGHPDLIILWGRHWGSLEFKKSSKADKQPNQEYYNDKLNDMSFSAFIYPENETEVLHALEQAFKPPRRTRISKS